jgi:cytochrome oxidase Cu insertion factor (SCO1/SenC/PrrC family)
MTSSSPSESAHKSSRKQLWLLVAIFFAPLLFAFVMYYGVGWRPAGSTNKGDLIDPPRPVVAGELLSPQDQPIEEEIFTGKWTLVYIGNGRCDERCRTALTLMRQTRLALNDDASRVRRVFLATEDCCDIEYLATEHPGLVPARADDEADRELLAIFPRYQNVPVQSAGRIYIIDPLGNLMMSYSPAAPQKALLEDLRKLLKLSHIG